MAFLRVIAEDLDDPSFFRHFQHLDLSSEQLKGVIEVIRNQISKPMDQLITESRAKEAMQRIKTREEIDASNGKASGTTANGIMKKPSSLPISPMSFPSSQGSSSASARVEVSVPSFPTPSSSSSSINRPPTEAKKAASSSDASNTAISKRVMVIISRGSGTESNGKFFFAADLATLLLDQFNTIQASEKEFRREIRRRVSHHLPSQQQKGEEGAAVTDGAADDAENERQKGDSPHIEELQQQQQQRKKMGEEEDDQNVCQITFRPPPSLRKTMMKLTAKMETLPIKGEGGGGGDVEEGDGSFDVLVSYLLTTGSTSSGSVSTAAYSHSSSSSSLASVIAAMEKEVVRGKKSLRSSSGCEESVMKRKEDDGDGQTLQRNVEVNRNESPI